MNFPTKEKTANGVYKLAIFLIFPGFLSSILIWVISQFTLNVGLIFSIYLLIFSISMCLVYFLYIKNVNVFLVFLAYFLSAFLVLIIINLFDKYVPVDWILLLFISSLNPIGIYVFFLFYKNLTPRRLKVISFFLILFSIVIVPLGIKNQVDIYHGYCQKEGRFLSEKEKIERVIKLVMNHTEANDYLNRIDECCSFAPPVIHLAEDDIDLSFKHQMRGNLNGQVAIIMLNGERKTYQITNCAVIVNF